MVLLKNGKIYLIIRMCPDLLSFKLDQGPIVILINSNYQMSTIEWEGLLVLAL